MTINSEWVNRLGRPWPRLRGTQEAKVDRIRRKGLATVWLFVVLLSVFDSIALAQPNQPARAKPPDSTTLAPLPAQ